MTVLKKILKLIDSISEIAGSIGKWFALLLVLVGAYDTIARHFFNAPTIWSYDTLCMMGGTLYLIGASYVYLHDSHTRVDVIYNLLSLRKQALVNLICSVVFFFPLMLIMLKLSISWAIRAWRINEVMFQSFWYPPAAPYRTVFALGIFLLILQGVARFIRDLYFIVRGEPID
jgi:TRAP-type mannitol/chloroaromatic compound transport system permease small subunit